MRLSIAFLIDSVEITPGIVAGVESLGGSESACLGLARALRARGHDVHIFSTKIAADVAPVDHAGVRWYPIASLALASIFYDFDVLVGLRMPHLVGMVPARLRILWNQDLLTPGPMKGQIMSFAWAFDACAYVSAYHRKQWEGVLPELAPIGWVTRNGFDPALVPDPKTIAKKPNQIIHISRPERGLEPILQMWPELRRQEPNAELVLCRYSSMYDKDGWGKVCAQFDRLVQVVNAEAGGITYLGELGKPALYKAIAESAVMWYPGVSTFAETSCIAAVEAQANSTPFVGSYKGALPETVPSGVLLTGAAETDPVYQAASIAAVRDALKGCRDKTFGYRQTIAHGHAHVAMYTYAAIAAEWEAWLLEQFQTRYEAEKVRVLDRLTYEDDFVAAKTVAEEILATGPNATAETALARAAAVCDGETWGPTEYADTALDPILELESGSARLKFVIDALAGRTRVLDVACGNGAFAIALAEADPARHVVAIDYAPANIAAARSAAETRGVADRIRFICTAAWDFKSQQPTDDLLALADASFDGLWCGEFLEHVADVAGLVDALEACVVDGGQMVFSCPFGPISNLATRGEAKASGHVHHLRPADLDALFGRKRDIAFGVLPWQARTPLGEPVGNRTIAYRKDVACPTGQRPLDRVALTRPLSRVSVGLITDSTLDIRRCLDAVWPIADEIILGNCGADPLELARLCEEFPRKTRVLEVGRVADLRGGFSEARNRVLDAATGEWFLWIDCDETLVGGGELGKYLDARVFNGYVITQNHFYLDAPMSFDVPYRLFRRRPDIRFYGCIHEQPQMGDCNTDITPGLQVDDVKIAHTGYLHVGIRRQKMVARNLPLLVRDQEIFPDRELGKLLVLRDYANLAMWAKEQAGGRLTEGAKGYERAVIGLFEDHFLDPSHRFHKLARPFYEAALRDVDGAIEVEVGLVGATNGLGGQHVTPERAWARTPAHLRQLLQARLDDTLKPLESPEPLDLEPIVTMAEAVV
jgi:2-polyprenyl-3-methyl-5-hydroxy-6-metoxy-1,4-benzoquinol methylase/glycosyltransferase involved in cell wall biosynthesis